jgi:hypothetical protein
VRPRERPVRPAQTARRWVRRTPSAAVAPVLLQYVMQYFDLESPAVAGQPAADLGRCGALGGTRTPNLLIRRAQGGVRGDPSRCITTGQTGVPSEAVQLDPLCKQYLCSTLALGARTHHNSFTTTSPRLENATHLRHQPLRFCGGRPRRAMSQRVPAGALSPPMALDVPFAVVPQGRCPAGIGDDPGRPTGLP